MTDLQPDPPGLGRWLHGMLRVPSARNLPRVARSLSARIAELAHAAVADTMSALHGQPEPILRLEAGEASRPGRRSVALYVHYCAAGTVSEMVRRQLETYDRLGFETVFISNAPHLPEAEWQAARARTALAVHRRNLGLDFGAWKNLAAEAMRRWPDAEELLLVNDSVLGPLRPLEPALAVMRAGGEGVFGLLESIQGGPHLQSWFVLARGKDAVKDLAAFLDEVRLSASKWRIVQRGELRMARAMMARGHRVAALYAYRDLLEHALADPEERTWLATAVPHLARFARLPDAEAIDAMRRKLLQRPLNPAHHLWRVLTGPAACPFLKTELVRRNPGKLPGVETWPGLVPADAPCPTPVLRAHLAALDASPAPAAFSP